MSAKSFRIKFLRPAQIEKAPADPRKGGFDVELIPVGTVMNVNEASYRYWKSRVSIELLDKPEGRRYPVEQETEPVVFGVTEERALPSKTSIRRAAQTARKALNGNDLPLARESIAYIARDVTLEVVPIKDDDWEVLTAARESVLSVHFDELIEVLRDLEDLLAPPSQKRRRS